MSAMIFMPWIRSAVTTLTLFRDSRMQPSRRCIVRIASLQKQKCLYSGRRGAGGHDYDGICAWRLSARSADYAFRARPKILLAYGARGHHHVQLRIFRIVGSIECDLFSLV